MKKLIAVLIAATFAGASMSVIANEQTKAEKKPTAAECKKEPKKEGCPVKK